MSDETKKAFGIDVEKMMPQITEEVAAKLKQRAVDSLVYEVNHAVAKAVSSYIDENIVPSVKEELKAHDAEIRAAIVAGVVGASKALAARIAEDATKKLASYEGDQMVRKMVTSIFGY
jgi:hypothetical protein